MKKVFIIFLLLVLSSNVNAGTTSGALLGGAAGFIIGSVMGGTKEKPEPQQVILSDLGDVIMCVATTYSCREEHYASEVSTLEFTKNS